MVCLTTGYVIFLMLMFAVRAGPVTNSTSGWPSDGNIHRSEGSAFIHLSSQVNSNTPYPRSINGRTSEQTLLSTNEQIGTIVTVEGTQKFQDNESLSHQSNESDNHHFKNRDTSSQPYSKANSNCDTQRTNCNNYGVQDHNRSRIVDNSSRYITNSAGVSESIHEQGSGNSQARISKDISRSRHTQTKPRQNSEERFSMLGLGVGSAGPTEKNSSNNEQSSSSVENSGSSTAHNKEILRSVSSNNQSTNGQLHSNKPKVEARIVGSQEELSRHNQNRSLSSSNINDLNNNTASTLAPKKEERKFFYHDEEILLKPNSGIPGEQSYEEFHTNTPKGRIVTPTSYMNLKPYKAQNTNQTGATSGSKIIFPGEMENNNVPKFKPEVDGPRPKCADQQPFCENADHYPRDYVKKLLENDVNLGRGFKDYIRVEIDTRIQPDDKISLCPSSEQVVYPKVAQNKEDKWLYVVNQDPHVQGVRIEKCEKQDKCSFSENFPSGYITSCQQKYIYRKLLAVGENGEAVSDSFRLPSCCSCIITKQFPMARMGNAEKTTPAPPSRRR